MLPVPKAANLFCEYCHALMAALRESPYGGFFCVKFTVFHPCFARYGTFFEKMQWKNPPWGLVSRKKRLL